METTKKWSKLLLAGMLGMVLGFGMMVVGCSSIPKSFQRGSGGETTILLRQGLDFDQVFREVAFLLNRHGFETETIQPEVGYIRTRWNFTWNDSGKTLEVYRVRILCNFNPSRTQLIVKAEAEYLNRGDWVSGFDTRAIETLRTDLNNVIGN
ncbi:MAG: hypothetical protein LBQ46_08800 [Treponema sp.]|jgi:hypothetical protein|nr:hypothetical protein [Treponema sp.]